MEDVYSYVCIFGERDGDGEEMNMTSLDISTI